MWDDWADCRKCADARIEAGADPFSPAVRRMFLCPQCGNKRCPKATDHDLACTDSNEPGQQGSAYE